MLRLAKHLASKGVYITFSTTHSAGHSIQKSTNNYSDTPLRIGEGYLRFEFFSDGWEDVDVRRLDLDIYMPQLETVGRESFIELVNRQDKFGRPVSGIINNPFLPWVLDIATEMRIPCAVQWVQSCAVYSAYYHYFHELAPFPTADQPDLSVSLPGLPTMEFNEIPTFLHPFGNPLYIPLKKAILGQFKNMSKAFCVLVDSFEELEKTAIDSISRFSPIRTVGPLFKFKEEENSTSSLRADMWSASEESIEWLDKQPPATVIYVSLGSVVFLEKDQMEEMARALLNSGLPFLWVVKAPPKEFSEDGGRLPEGFLEESEGKGLVVQWCPQDRVLAHPSLACFVTHCGWSSSMEILCTGVPIVAAPQWGDQVTNGKFLADVYGVGVRLLYSEKDLKTLSREKIVKCIKEVTSGSKAEEIKENIRKWKKIAEEASEDGGSSQRNLLEFIDDIKRLSSK